MRNIILISILLSLTGLVGCGYGETSAIYDTTGKVIDSKRVFNEMGDVKSYKNMLLFKISDSNNEIFILRMDSDGRNLKKLFQYKYKRADSYTAQSKIYFTENGKILIDFYYIKLIPHSSGSTDMTKASFTTDDEKYYMANWDGSGFVEIALPLYLNYFDKYAIISPSGMEKYD